MILSEQPKDGNKRLRTSYVSSVISISLVLFMMGLLGLLVLDAKKLSDYVKEHVQVNIFLKDNTSESQVSKMMAELRSMSFVKSASYISKEQALDSLKSELGEDAIGMLDANPLPATIDVNVSATYAHSDSLKKIKATLSNMPSVLEVEYQLNEVDKMNKNFRTVAMIILIFCGLLLFIAVVLINNTIKLSLYSKRFLIKSMQLVGATKGFIRWPFMIRSFVHGFYAGLISIVLLGAIIYFIQQRFPEFGQLSDMKLLGILFGGVIVVGFLLSGLSTYLAVNRHLHRRIDELY